MRFETIVGYIFCLVWSLLWEWLQIFMLLTDIMVYSFYKHDWWLKENHPIMLVNILGEIDLLYNKLRVFI